MGKKLIAAAALLSAVGLGTSAYASAVSATYDTLTPDNPDIGTNSYGRGEAVTDTLGPNGFPVEKSAGLYKNVNTATGEIQWWNPVGNSYVKAGTTYAWPTTVTLPFDYSYNLYPNGPNGNDGDVGYVATHLKATFTAPTSGTVTFNLGSDDDAFVYLNGQLVVDNAGIQGFSSAKTVVQSLVAGTDYTVDVFQVDRKSVQSGLYFDADVQLNAVPEPSTWAMMGIGFAALGFAGYRARKASVSAA